MTINTISVKMREIATATNVNRLDRISIAISNSCVIAATAVDTVVARTFPMTPSVGQPYTCAGKEKNKMGIIQRNKVCADAYFSPPKINIAVLEKKKQATHPTVMRGIKSNITL